jgi:hypothetical protein
MRGKYICIIVYRLYQVKISTASCTIHECCFSFGFGSPQYGTQAMIFCIRLWYIHASFFFLVMTGTMRHAYLINLEEEHELGIRTKRQTQCQRLPHEWGLGKGITEVKSYPCRNSAERRLRTQDLVTRRASTHQHELGIRTQNTKFKFEFCTPMISTNPYNLTR